MSINRRSTLSPARSPEDVRSDIMDLVEEYFRVAHRAKPVVPGESSVPVSGRTFDAADVKSLVDSALEFWLTSGRYNEMFQAHLAKRVGARYSLTGESGSSAKLAASSSLSSPL